MPSVLHTLPLTPTQAGMLFHHLSAAPGSGVDVEQIVCTLDESVDADRLHAAWQQVQQRHETLRSRLRWEGVEDPVLEVLGEASLPWTQLDWSQQAAESLPATLEDFLAKDRAQGFALDQAPFMRVTLIRASSTPWTMVWTVHHVACDGRSFPIVLGEVFKTYDDGPSAAPASGSTAGAKTFGDHARHVAAMPHQASEPFWRERLNGVGATPLPVGATATVSGRGDALRVLSPQSDAALRSMAQSQGLSLNTLVQGAWALLLARFSGEPVSDVVFGATRAGRATSVGGAETIVGCLINTLPVRVTLDEQVSVADFLLRLRDNERAVRPHEQTPLMSIQGWSAVPAGTPLFDSLLVYDHASLDGQMHAQPCQWQNRHAELHERTNYPLTLYAYGETPLQLQLAYDEPRFDATWAQRLLDSLQALLEGMAADPQRALASLPLLTQDAARQLLQGWNDTATAWEQACVHEAIEAQVARTPDATALVFRGQTISYSDLNTRANRLAYHLRGLGVGPDVPVGLCADRSVELIIGLLAIHKAGGCYLPLDPNYPHDRLAYMMADARAPVLLTQTHLQNLLPGHEARVVLLDDADTVADRPQGNPVSGARPEHLAYVIYTSGSTGKPKGVMVEHRNVLNFFTGMDARIPVQRHADGSAGTWLAVTSLSFDISVLELLWTLARGFRVVLHEDQQRAAALAVRPGQHADKGIAFSLMYFASSDTAGAQKYRLLLEGAKFADQHGFLAVWTPERHFHAFGGLYPNPSVVSAALAAVTQRIGLRAGSVVNALHHPARIAEEWSVVDNLSNGRVGISFASGWQPRDFVLAPEAFGRHRDAMVQGIDQVRKLWRGEAISFPGPNGQDHDVQTLPRPVQSELPFWITAAGAPDTFRMAGELGAGILTHLLGQSMDEVASKLKIYREAWQAAGHPGNGHVTLMLHTFIGEDTDTVRETVRQPMKNYLATSLGLVKGFAQSWSAFKKRADGSTSVDVDLDSLTPEEMDGLLSYSFERYFETSSLFGDMQRALDIVDRIKGLGVDEIACLIDFGVEEEKTLQHLVQLNQLREQSQPALAAHPADGQDESVAAQIERYDVSHLQCTPSLASMLLQDPSARSALAQVRVMMVGGEALPPTVAAQIKEAGVQTLLNMYGPTETTIWSAVHEVQTIGETIPIGTPIANTQLYVLDRQGRLVPPGVPGELHIAGAGVVRGYLGRPELTAERFVPDPYCPHLHASPASTSAAPARMYRTGDLARWRADGIMEFMGRLDHQVKIRGHRIELGEIEANLAEHAAVREAVVMAREDIPGDVRLVAYLLPSDPAQPPQPRDLKDHVRAHLPETMVPAHFVVLERFPQTPNRKIDRKALPAPADALPASTVAGGAERAPAGEMETKVADVWREVLQLPAIGRDDNFFDLGGHSLLAVKVHRRLTEISARSVAITDLFRFPTVKALAEFLSQTTEGDTPKPMVTQANQRREAMAARRAARARI